MDELIFSEGVLWEDYPWEIHFDKKVELDENKLPCKHAYDLKTIINTRTFDDHTYETHHCYVPKVLIAYNEGHYNSTGLCLDCVLEKVKEHKLDV